MAAKTTTASESGKDMNKAGSEHGVDSVLVGRAMEALLTHHEVTTKASEKQQLLGSDVDVQVQIGLNRVPESPSPKPIRILIPHSIYASNESTEEPSVCLIVKEESKPWVQELIGQFPKEMKNVQKVLGLQSLRTKFKQFQQKRDLLHRYDVFMADDRILPMLAKCLGKSFFKTKKQPIPIRLTRKEALPLSILKNLSATYMYMSPGTCLTIRAGNTGMDRNLLVENVEAIARNAALRIPKRWSNIRSVSIKTTDSLALPVYSKTPLELLELNDEKPLEGDDNAVNKKETLAQSKKKRKQEASKSPLIQALKKQKQKKESSRQKETPAKKKKQKTTKDEPKSDSKSRANATDRSPLQSKETPKKKSPAAAKESAEKQTSRSYIASKKYKGSKQGYAFRVGPNGVGYYVDVLPVVDKAAMSALAKLGSGRKKSRRR